MKTPYWLIAIFAAIAAVIGASLATYHSVSPPPIATISPLPSPTPTRRPSPSPSSPSPQPSPPPGLTEQSKLVINGIPPIRVGMTVIEATKAVGLPARTDGDVVNQKCFYYKFQGGVPGLSMMVVGDRIVRVDIRQGSKITTRSGAGIGSSEDQIKALYPGQIEVTPHPYVKGGHYLTFVPKSAADSKYRLIFETDKRGKVTEFRTGQMPEVAATEGCA